MAYFKVEYVWRKRKTMNLPLHPDNLPANITIWDLWNMNKG
jgi:hypothetical protein